MHYPSAKHACRFLGVLVEARAALIVVLDRVSEQGHAKTGHGAESFVSEFVLVGAHLLKSELFHCSFGFSAGPTPPTRVKTR